MYDNIIQLYSYLYNCWFGRLSIVSQKPIGNFISDHIKQHLVYNQIKDPFSKQSICEIEYIGVSTNWPIKPVTKTHFINIVIIQCLPVLLYLHNSA
jgi:hypothetical protein